MQLRVLSLHPFTLHSSYLTLHLLEVKVARKQAKIIIRGASADNKKCD